jgi:hypothetical protein
MLLASFLGNHSLDRPLEQFAVARVSGTDERQKQV